MSDKSHEAAIRLAVTATTKVLTDRIKELEAENARLRAALEQYASSDVPD